jgi:hypothetical protein
MLRVSVALALLVPALAAASVLDPEIQAIDAYLVGDAANGDFAETVVVGDFDGDGFDDLVVSAPDELAGSGMTGEVRLYAGSPGGLGAPTLVPNQSNSWGRALAAGDDVDGDGYEDLLVGGLGHVAIFRGGASGLDPTPWWSATGTAGGWGLSAAFIGDVNGDGWTDVAVGAASDSSDNGRIYVYLGSAAGMGTFPQELSPNGTDYRFGHAISAWRDLDADGYDEFVVTAPGRYSSTSYVTARAYVLHGTQFGVDPDYGDALAVYEGSAGLLVADLDGDGARDVALGGADGTASSSALDGGVRVIAGSVVDLDPVLDKASFGHSLAAGDFDGDGQPDLLVGAPTSRHPVDTSTAIGAVAVHYGDGGTER